MPTKNLHIDIETRSGADLKKVGVYKYVEDEDFEIILFGFGFEGEEVKVWDMTGYKRRRFMFMPEEARNYWQQQIDYLRKILTDRRIIKHAFNANFERVCLQKYLNLKLDPAQWRCTMVHAAYAGLAGGSLKSVAAALGVEEQKDAAGTRLINKFSKPPFVSPEDDPVGWNQFKDYCRQDVVTEMAVSEALQNITIPEMEQRLYTLDQKINDAGLPIDRNLADRACIMLTTAQKKAKQRMKDLTGLENPNSVLQLKTWLNSVGYRMLSVSKSDVEKLLKLPGLAPDVREVLELRLESGLSSTKKYYVMQDATCDDNRIRGCLQFYGALTGRWAGRLLQIQNLPATNIPDLDAARLRTKHGCYDDLIMLYGSVPLALKNLIRTSITAPDGKRLFVADFSAIEARVLAWLAGEQWVLDVFAGDGRIYEAVAAKMFNVPIDAVTKEQRQRGKVAVLACGYGGGVGAMSKSDVDLSEREKTKIVKDWRRANPSIVRFWGDIEQAVKAVIRTQKTRKVGRVFIGIASETLYIHLPSGRRLHYRKPFTRLDTIHYVDTKRKVSTYGGKLVENITQAVARDILAEALLALDAAGYKIIGHVHDEVIVEGDSHETSIDTILAIITRRLPWSAGLPIAANGFVSEFYYK